MATHADQPKALVATLDKFMYDWTCLDIPNQH